MEKNRLTRIALLALVACSGCERNERQEQRDQEDLRSPPAPPPRAESQPTATPNTTAGKQTVGAREEVALAKGDREAEANFKAVKGQKISGDAELREMPNGVQIIVELEDAPTGMKAIHIHEKGDCSNVEAMSMGKHFAPKGEKHGLPATAEHHLGDLGNITVDDKGKGRLEITAAGANLKENDAMSFLGKAIVVHSSKDTGAQPDGAAGKPLACAVIEKD